MRHLKIEHQNVTLSLPKEFLLTARHLAVERGLSLSRLLAMHLEDLVLRESAYEEAKQRAVTRMRQGLAMGLGEKPAWTRAQLHER